MSERVQRCVYLETGRTPEDVRAAFAQCGDIRGIYAGGTTENSTSFRYFVEYREPWGAKHAHALQLEDTIVHALESSPHLIEHFHAVSTPGLPPKPQAEVLQTARWTPYRKKKSRHAQQAKEKNRPSTYTIIEPAIAMSKISYSTPGALTRARADSFDKENHLRRSTAIEYREHEHAPGSYHAVDDPAVYVTAYNGHSVSSSMSGFTEPSSSTSTLSDPNGHCAMPVWSALQMGPESDSSWSMMSRGDSAQMIMDNSLEAVIETLKVTANHPLECAKWVVVAAHYRSQGNTAAAIAVMSGMIEVMLAAGMDLAQLKPAVLMLSSCHLDVARRLRTLSGATAESQYHLNKACDGFRQVYGSYDPPPIDALEDSHPAAPSSALALPLTSSDPSLDSNTHLTADDANPISPPPQPSTPKTAPCAAHGTPASSSCASPKGPRFGHMKMLEREIQSLRDKQHKQQDTLLRTRSAKRKVQDELDREQHRRRKLEGQLEKAEKALTGAQRDEQYALEQCRAELETRRRAEDHVEELKQRVAVVEARLAEGEERERKTKEYFQKMGVAFLKASVPGGDVPGVVPVVRL